MCVVGLFMVIWYVVFMIFFFVWVKEVLVVKFMGGIGVVLSELMQLVKNVVKCLSFVFYFVFLMFYCDVLNVFYGFGGVYVVLVLDWLIILFGVFGILVVILVVVFIYIGGFCDKCFGLKLVILFNIWMLIIVCVVIVGMLCESFYGILLVEGFGLFDLIFMVFGVIIGVLGGVV